MLRMALLAAVVMVQSACVNLATLQTARVESGARVDTQLVVQADPYRKQDVDTTDSMDALSQVGAAAGIRYSEDDRFELGVQLTSSFVLRGNIKYQFLDLGPLAMATGVGLGADLPHAFVWLIDKLDDDEAGEGEVSDDEAWAGEFMLPLMVSLHITDHVALYGAGRYHMWSFDDEAHSILAATAGMCVGKDWGVCAEVCMYESHNSDLDGIFGAASFFFDVHDGYLR